MKTAIGLSAAFVGILALIARSADPAPSAAGAWPTSLVASGPVTSEASRRPASGVVPPAVGRPSPSSPPAPVSMQIAAQAPTPGLLTARLDHELGLSVPQRERVEEILRARESEVGAVQNRVLKSGYFNPRETDPQLAALREDSYVQISMLLDREQNRRFAEVLRTNSINDHMVISLPESLVLLD